MQQCEEIWLYVIQCKNKILFSLKVKTEFTLNIINQSPVVNICTTKFNVKNFYVLPRIVYCIVFTVLRIKRKVSFLYNI